MARSGLTREAVMKWAGTEVFNQGVSLCTSNAVSDIRYDAATRTISGRVKIAGDYPAPLSVFLDAHDRVRTDCPCQASQRFGQICPHATAIGFALTVLEMEDELQEPENAPTATEEDAIEVPMAPKICAYVSGSRASLSVEVDACYGKEIVLPAGSVQSPRVVWLEDPDDPLVRRVRSLRAEQQALRVLTNWQLSPAYSAVDGSYATADPMRVLNFLGAGIPDLRRRGWQVELSPKLTELTDKMPSVLPLVVIKDAPNGDFDVAYSFEVVTADGRKVEIDPVEVQAAIARGDGYILRDAGNVLVDCFAIKAMHEVFSDCAFSQNGAARGCFRVKGVYAPYVRASLDALDISCDDAAASHWHTASRPRGSDVSAPYAPVDIGRLDGILRPYQKQGVFWMRFLEQAGQSGLLADEMGLGKTLQTLTWLSLPCASGGPARPALIVCPTSLVRNWEAEARRFIPELKVLVISGPDRAKSFPRIDEANLVVTSYALLQRDLEAAYLHHSFSTIVLDEAQHIKNHETKNALAVKALSAERRLALTGTPVENSVADVWSIFDFLMPGYLGEYEAFKEAYEDPIAAADAGAESVLSRLKRKIDPFILRRVKKSVAKDLPDKIVKVSYCPMSDEAQREYAAALLATRRQAGDIIRAKGFAKCRFELLALLMKLRQIASRAKVEPFLEQLETAIAGGHKILVFSQFVTILKTLSDELAHRGVRFCYLDGSTKERLRECERFNRTPEIPVFLISLMAGGTGLNLTGADMVMHYDPWWNPAVEDQATDRAHRIGQKKTVYVIKMIAAGSVEEKVLALQRRKQAIIAATVGTTDAAVMERLTAQDLNELLS